MRWLLITTLAIVLAVDIGFGFIIEKYEVNTYSSNSQKEKNQQQTLQGPFIIGTKAAALDFLAFVDGNDNAITALSTFIIAIFTIILAIATSALLRMARKQDVATKTIERAYVKMSHAPPGLRDIDRNTGNFTVLMEIKNWGSTPAHVTNALVVPRVVVSGTQLPESPDYGEPPATEKHAFLVTNENFFISMNGGGYSPQIENGEHILYLWGYVDYKDAFGKRHRSGYARKYDPRPQTMRPQERMEGFLKRINNLFFVTQEGYNYDRQRKKGEGNDWGE